MLQSEGHRELAVLYDKQRLLDKAVGQYHEVLRLKQDEMEARLALISLYVKMKDYQGSEKAHYMKKYTNSRREKVKTKRK
ncbi:MAG: hypothetical protein HZC44_02905 [Geobacter sp.]|nr:hypothetical protein [Geobacter sp.]